MLSECLASFVWRVKLMPRLYSKLYLLSSRYETTITVDRSVIEYIAKHFTNGGG
jgi:hypothetical protein